MLSKHFHWTFSLSGALVCAGVLLTAATAHAADPDRSAIIRKGLHYLTAAQAEDGSFSARVGVGPTAMAVLAMLRNGQAVNDPTVAKGLAYLEKAVQANGGIYQANSRVPNYETCVALLCLKEANKDGRYDEKIKKADGYVRSVQWSDKDSSDFNYGGAGYRPGSKSRPDLSNTSSMIDALRAAGTPEDEEALKRAAIFVSRCQNLETEHNTTPLAAKVNDGGFYYALTVDQRGNSGGPQGGLRSYGSMTYSGLKSLLYAGVAKDDPRVKAAVAWIQKHYDLKNNPGMGEAGLYYYYHTFAKALDALGQSELEDGKGAKHDWRSELTAELANRQKSNGSWVNSNEQWMENDPNLATSFALLALSYCEKQ
jgi:squalene-hopene/tetraprenyl-beta-curcumene cyclase